MARRTPGVPDRTAFNTFKNEARRHSEFECSAGMFSAVHKKMHSFAVEDGTPGAFKKAGPGIEPPVSMPSMPEVGVARQHRSPRAQLCEPDFVGYRERLVKRRQGYVA
jgi:hypothetical protein